MELTGKLINIAQPTVGKSFSKQEFTLQTNNESITLLLFNRIELIQPYTIGEHITVLYNQKAGINYVNYITRPKVEPKPKAHKTEQSQMIYQQDDSINFWIVGYNENGTPILNTGELDLVELGF